MRFQETDAAILFCIPERGCNLDSLVERYTCFERTAVPNYEVVAGCLGRSVRAGTMPLPDDGVYHLSPEWWALVHRRDGEFSASEFAMIEFAEELVAHEWPEIGTLDFVLPVSEYQRAADHTRRYLDRLFSPYRR